MKFQLKNIKLCLKKDENNKEQNEEIEKIKKENEDLRNKNERLTVEINIK